MLAGRFYRFTYEVEEVLVKNPGNAEEEDLIPVDGTKADQTPKRKRTEQEKGMPQPEAVGRGNIGGSYHGGKACRLLYDDKEGSPSTESDGDNSLLIETLQREIEEKMKEGDVDSSNWIVPRNPVVMETHVQDIQVKKVIHNKFASPCQTASNPSQIVDVTAEVDPGLNTSSSYMVQLPSFESVEEIIITPPLAPKAPLRFNKRNASRMQDKVEDKVE